MATPFEVFADERHWECDEFHGRPELTLDLADLRCLIWFAPAVPEWRVEVMDDDLDWYGEPQATKYEAMEEAYEMVKVALFEKRMEEANLWRTERCQL
jgi:hypothetical protein